MKKKILLAATLVTVSSMLMSCGDDDSVSKDFDEDDPILDIPGDSLGQENPKDSLDPVLPKDTVDSVLPKDTVNPVQPKDSLSQELPKDSLGNDEIKDEVAVAKFDIALSIEDIIVDWYGGGGEKDPDNNSFTYKQYANNYWDIHDLNTDVYTKVEINFAKAVAYDNIDVIATYSDEAKTTERIPSGATSLVLSFEPGKTLVSLALVVSPDTPSDAATISFGKIIIRAKDSDGTVGKMPVKSPKLGLDNANPILDFQYCADPTAIEYKGRLYVYGTNDHQQYEEGVSNTYEKIKTLVMMSTDDMVNWTYHGLIPVGEVAPWIMASWAPSIISKEQADGSTLFSLYFSNSGFGTGVIQAKSPVGPWTSPLSKSLIDGDNPVVKGSGSIFDPGAVIDDNGDGWISFGNGQGWIAKLNPDLHSLDGDPVKLPSPFHFEANELNYINGKYVYTFNNDWNDHTPWEWGGEAPTACSMNYFTSTEPLNPDSWTYGGNYFKNMGENGMTYGNNHTHLHKYQDKWYIFYQAAILEASIGSHGGFRSILVDEIEVDEANVVIKEAKPTYKGVKAIKNLDPYSVQQASTAAATLGIRYVPTEEPGHMVASVGTPSKDGPAPTEGVIEVRNVNFSSAKTLKALVKGKGSVTLRLDKRDGANVASINSAGSDWQEQEAKCGNISSGVHTVYLIIKGDVLFDTWQFAN